MRRGALVAGVAVGVALLLGSYVLYTQRVVTELRGEASRNGRMYAQIYRALSDTSTDETGAFLDLSRHIRESGVPLVITDVAGRPSAHANLPIGDDVPPDDPRVLSYVAELDRQNEPVIEPGIGTVHFGNTPLVAGLRVIPLFQAGMLLLLILAGVYALRVRDQAERERVWAGMARESAHQLGTPLSSLSGWIELLRERADDPMTASAISHMDGDLDRLQRVANRFERIGRPPRSEPIDSSELIERVASYFRARVPTLAHTVTIAVKRPDKPIMIEGDQVLLEWALEALIKNAVDALAGRGGRVLLSATRLPEGGVRLRVADDGPGIPRELRSRVFAAGFTTKQSGWGIGLSLTNRIVRDTHGGLLRLVPTDRGATFDIILP